MRRSGGCRARTGAPKARSWRTAGARFRAGARQEFAYTPTGRLSFTTSVSYLRTRCSWADAKRQRLEECLNDMTVGFVDAAEAMRANDERIEAQRLVRGEEERRRQAAQRHAEEEAARRRALSASMKAWRKSSAMREYGAEMRAALEAGQHANGVALQEWLAWAECYADMIDLRKAQRVPQDMTARPVWSPGYGTAVGR